MLKQSSIRSPLDVMNKGPAQSQASTSPSAVKRPVGTLRLEVEHLSESGQRTAKAAVLILNPRQPVRLEGIMLREARPGWISMELPRHEIWEEALSRLTSEQRERIDSPEFFDYLRVELGTRFLRSADGRIRESSS